MNTVNDFPYIQLGLGHPKRNITTQINPMPDTAHLIEVDFATLREPYRIGFMGTGYLRPLGSEIFIK